MIFRLFTFIMKYLLFEWESAQKIEFANKNINTKKIKTKKK